MVVAAGVALAFGATAIDGRADGSPPEAGAHLSWIRSASASACPDAGHVQADVVQRLGRNPFTEPSQTFVEASVSKDGARWQAEIEMRDAAGHSLGRREV